VDAIRVFIRKSLDQKFKLRLSDILRLNRVAIEGLNPLAGVFRPDEMIISYSRHNPPPPEFVPELMEAMCDSVNENLNKSPSSLSCVFTLADQLDSPVR
jgi:hypothetical protein